MIGFFLPEVPGLEPRRVASRWGPFCFPRMSAFTDIREYEGSASSENVTFHPVTEGFVGQQTFNQDDKNLLGSHPGNS
ncbi:hypothetical protein N806_32975 [Rhodococcus sp. P27]|nr:hypothetical protein N806_17000 [Rhodococcus sp. P27]ERB55929.1 hypothetical protein N806_32975 [Rhodococcus sp. P27]